MSTTAVGQCPHCSAVINRHWTSCLVCHAILSPTGETGGNNLTTTPTLLQPGALVSWVRADGTRQIGFVDFLHTDSVGQQWAVVSFGKSWAAVDRKKLTVVMP